MEVGDKNEQERFFNPIFSNDYFSSTIITIHSIDIEKST